MKEIMWKLLAGKKIDDFSRYVTLTINQTVIDDVVFMFTADIDKSGFLNCESTRKSQCVLCSVSKRN